MTQKYNIRSLWGPTVRVFVWLMFSNQKAITLQHSSVNPPPCWRQSLRQWQGTTGASETVSREILVLHFRFLLVILIWDDVRSYIRNSFKGARATVCGYLNMSNILHPTARMLTRPQVLRSERWQPGHDYLAQHRTLQIYAKAFPNSSPDSRVISGTR